MKGAEPAKLAVLQGLPMASGFTALAEPLLRHPCERACAGCDRCHLQCLLTQQVQCHVAAAPCSIAPTPVAAGAEILVSFGDFCR